MTICQQRPLVNNDLYFWVPKLALYTSLTLFVLILKQKIVYYLIALAYTVELPSSQREFRVQAALAIWDLSIRGFDYLWTQ